MPRLAAQLRRKATPVRLAAVLLACVLASGCGALGGFTGVWPGTRVRFGVYAGQGVLSIGAWEQRLVQSGVLAHASPRYTLGWLPSFTRVSPSWEIKLPLWLLILPLLFAHIRHQRVSQRRRMDGQCVGCGYSRSGLSPEAKCPECGLQPPAMAPITK